MGLPEVNITFKELAKTAIKRGSTGIVALILQDTVPGTNPVIMYTVDDIPAVLSAESKEQLNLAFMGYQNTPTKVIAYIIPVPAENASADYTAAQKYLETISWDYVAVPKIASADVTNFATWIKGCRDNKHLKVKAVLPNCSADHEGIINFATDNIVTKSKTYTAAQYCSRVAGLIAGTPLNISCTYAPLSEVVDVPHLTEEEASAAIDAGKFILINDDGVRVGRGVNSLVTTTENKGADYKKIKEIDIMDLVYTDIRNTLKYSYVGKYPNSYDNRLVLCTVINGYLEGLEADQLLEEGQNSVGIDIASTKIYLKSIGVEVTALTDPEVKEYNVGSNVFLRGTISILDAMEDFNLVFDLAA